MSCAELTLWARVEGLERDAVSQALWEEREARLLALAAREHQCARRRGGLEHRAPALEQPLVADRRGELGAGQLAGSSRACGATSARGKRLLVGVEPFVPVAAAARRAAEDEAERLAAFLGGTLELSWSS